MKNISPLKLTLTLLATLALSAPVQSQMPASTKTAVAAKQSFYSTSALSSRFSSWGVDPSKGLASINLSESWKKFKKKKNIVVAVIDTGIQYDHPFLSQNIFVKKGSKSRRNFGVDFSMKSASLTPKDTHGHGTHVSGIIKSVFPDVKILALKYYNPQASGQQNLNSTIQAFEYAVDQGVDVINYSGGGPEPSEEELRVLKKAEAKGILVISAAGNERSNIDKKKNAYYPASYGLSNIITVGAHDENINVIASSNYGKKSVDIAAPGYRIKSAIHNGGAGHMTGTSQATAFVTGVVSMIKSMYPDLNYQQVRNIVLSSSVKVPQLRGKILGSGKLDASKALDLARNVYSKLYANGRKVARRNPSQYSK